jgi:RNA polymerase sigma-70 factor (ECF subfamily)
MLTSLNSVVRRVSAGDEGAFEELFEDFSPRIYGFALKLTHSPTTAEELVQEVFMKIWVNRKTLGNIDHFSAYVYTITRNLALSFLKRLAIEERAKAEYIKGVREETFETEETLAYRDYQSILKNAIDHLSPQQKTVYSLCHGEGLKYEEAAERLHISRLTVKTHMQQAIRNIRLHFKHAVSILSALVLSIPG